VNGEYRAIAKPKPSRAEDANYTDTDWSDMSRTYVKPQWVSIRRRR
jgi:hypothetical protein